MLEVITQGKYVRKSSFLLIFIVFIAGCHENHTLNFLETLDTAVVQDSIYIPKHEYELDNLVLGKPLKLERSVVFERHPEEPMYYRNKIVYIHENIRSLIVHPEWNTHIVNFNKEGVLVDYLDTSEFSGDCLVVGKEIICNQGYGYPYNSFKKYVINDNGNFEEKESYDPTIEKKIEPERFDYIVDKIPLLTSKESILLTPLDEDFFRDNYPNHINMANNISEFTEMFLERPNKTNNVKVSTLKSLLTEVDASYIWITFKINTTKHTTIAVNITSENNGDTLEDTIFLTYTKDHKLIDVVFNDYNKFKILNIKYIDNTVTIKKEQRYVRDPEIIIENFKLDDPLGQFNVLSNLQ